jgi:hypothetical protein
LRQELVEELNASDFVAKLKSHRDLWDSLFAPQTLDFAHVVVANHRALLHDMRQDFREGRFLSPAVISRRSRIRSPGPFSAPAFTPSFVSQHHMLTRWKSM